MRPELISLALEECLFHHGLALFNTQRFFAAHEAWETVWRRLPPGPKRAFYHGLIQCAVALEHYRRGNAVGVLRLHRTYGAKFAGLPRVFLGVEIDEFLADMDRALGPVLAANPIPRRGEMMLDAARAPRIALAYDPFGGGETATPQRSR